jgi:hypothetical protein
MADASVVVRGTAWDKDLTISAQTYSHTSGGAVSDIEQTSALSVDNAELRANFDAVTAEDIKAGLWDYASYEFFRVNPDDTSMGKDIILTGNVGQWTIRRLDFVAELRSRLQKLQQSFGRLVSTLCPYRTYDGDCGLDVADWTETGNLDSASDDGLTLYASDRTEPGPAGGVDITAITADGAETIITTDTAHGLLDGQSAYFSAIDGPVALNGPVTVRDPTAFTFRIAIDITDTAAYPAYVGDGVVTPLGAESGYYDGGTITITSGGVTVTREIKAFVPGQLTLHEAFPFALTTDAYSITAGDDHTWTTCRVKFANKRFGGFPSVPGNDHIMQVGRQQ